MENNNMFHFDKNYGLFVGKLLTNEFHQHYALQISVSIHATMKLISKDQYVGNAFFVPAKIEHKLISEDVHLTILINPLSPLGHYFHLIFGNKTIIVSQRDFTDKLIDRLTQLEDQKIDFSLFCKEVLTILNDYKCSCEVEYHSEDDRIVKSLEFMETNFETVYSAEQIAELCCVSVSRFLHLFKEKTGFNFRRYQLWNKLVKSLPYLMSNSITETAHQFGFTDSSHYTKTFKQTFGLNPKFISHAQ